MTGDDLATVVPPVPGPESRRLAAELRRYESRNITYVSDRFPVFFRSGRGANLEDVDGNVYVDLSGAFAVAASGHSNPVVTAAVSAQAQRLMHGMGDVHPTPEKVELARVLCELTPGGGEKRVIFSSSGAEAIESALKTAAVATGKPGVICFERAYHGLTYGALAVTDRDLFRAPFRRQLGDFAVRLPYAAPIAVIDRVFGEPGGNDIGAIIAEPIQARGGNVIPPPEWLRGLRAVCDRHEVVFIADEIYTGFGRTGRWFACDHAGVVPDIICVGKGMSSGFPISACVGKASVMDAWPESGGEAVHTSTFLGNPTGCAAALANIHVLHDRNLVERTAQLEPAVRSMLAGLRAAAPNRVGEIRGKGLMWGIECMTSGGAPDGAFAGRVLEEVLQLGIVMLASSPEGNVLQLAPPLVISERQIEFGVRCIARAMERAA